MPRIRRVKDWEALRASGLNDENLRQEPDDEETPPTSGVSYLSNASIIASMSDDQLRDTLARYKQLVSLMAEEQRVRKLSGRSSIPIAWPDMFETRPHVPKNRAKPMARGHAPHRLTKKQLIQIVEMLFQLTKDKNAT